MCWVKTSEKFCDKTFYLKYFLMDNLSAIAILKAQRQKAIDSFQIERAEELEKYIKDLESKSIQSPNIHKKKQEKRALEIEKDQIKKEGTRLVSDTSQKIYTIKISAQQKIAQRQTLHAQEMTALAERQAKDLEMAEIRPVLEANILRKTAQSQAQKSDYEQSKSILNQASQTENDEISLRRNEITAHYQKQKDLLLAKHQEENNNIYIKMNASIEEKMVEFKKGLRALKNRLHLILLKYHSSMSDQEFNSFFKDFKIQDESIELYRPIKDFQLTPIAQQKPKKTTPKSPKMTHDSPIPHYMTPRQTGARLLRSIVSS